MVLDNTNLLLNFITNKYLSTTAHKTHHQIRTNLCGRFRGQEFASNLKDNSIIHFDHNARFPKIISAPIKSSARVSVNYSKSQTRIIRQHNLNTTCENSYRWIPAETHFYFLSIIVVKIERNRFEMNWVELDCLQLINSY